MLVLEMKRRDLDFAIISGMDHASSPWGAWLSFDDILAGLQEAGEWDALDALLASGGDAPIELQSLVARGVVFSRMELDGRMSYRLRDDI
jgi:hypothetical protein